MNYLAIAGRTVDDKFCHGQMMLAFCECFFLGKKYPLLLICTTVAKRTIGDGHPIFQWSVQCVTLELYAGATRSFINTLIVSICYFCAQ